MRKTAYILCALLVFSVCANVVGLGVFDRMLFYRAHIRHMDVSFANKGLRLTCGDDIRKFSKAVDNLGVLVGGGLVRYWFLPGDLPILLVNRGGVEEKISDTLKRLPETVLGVEADYVVINAGFCEIHTAVNSGRDPAPVIERNFGYLKEIVARARGAGVKPLLTTLTPVRPHVLLPYTRIIEHSAARKAAENEALAKYNKLIRALSHEQRLPLIDFHAAMADKQGQLAAKYAGSDGEHISDEGYAVLNALLRDRLAEIGEAESGGSRSGR